MTSILSNLQILQWEKEYQTTYQQTLKMMTGIVESNPEEKEYFKTCIIKEIETNKKYILRFSKEIPYFISYRKSFIFSILTFSVVANM